MKQRATFRWLNVDGQRFAVSAHEARWWGRVSRDVIPSDRELHWIIVHGGYIPCAVSLNEAMQDIRAANYHTLGRVCAGVCRWTGLEDIKVYEPYDGEPPIPFSAILRTAEPIPGLLRPALVFFLRNPDLTVENNIICRRGIFAVKTREISFWPFGRLPENMELRANQARDMVRYP
jgi:hypothetical protein